MKPEAIQPLVGRHYSRAYDIERLVGMVRDFGADHGIATDCKVEMLLREWETETRAEQSPVDHCGGVHQQRDHHPTKEAIHMWARP
ncbi:hypothetical protein CPLU01_09963 [Colletotrichum plurivorum]|uniref:Uncharacterized protein n=1 Tax=Colletotrichum plurivorum TaxID=2175906 RepID=A0A8H6K842_9PEZI|nr:hypothetical protein CPLU01_09963 [Colletotrichum plurivorum]